jgi:hypothetical protein
VVGDEVLGTFGDPGEIADAELAAARERGRECQAGRIGERLRSSCGAVILIAVDMKLRQRRRQARAVRPRRRVSSMNLDGTGVLRHGRGTAADWR